MSDQIEVVSSNKQCEMSNEIELEIYFVAFESV